MLGSVESLNLQHELQVHQIELEMQNESLSETLVALEESRDRWVNSYELSPVGYLTLDKSTQITNINLTGAALLGQERRRLVNRRFAIFVVPEDRDLWHLHFTTVMKRSGTQNLARRTRLARSAEAARHGIQYYEFDKGDYWLHRLHLLRYLNL